MLKEISMERNSEIDAILKKLSTLINNNTPDDFRFNLIVFHDDGVAIANNANDDEIIKAMKTYIKSKRKWFK